MRMPTDEIWKPAVVGRQFVATPGLAWPRMKRVDLINVKLDREVNRETYQCG